MASDTKPLSALGLTATRGGDAHVTGVSLDSRDVKPGHLFAALPGTRVHGGEFIQYALRQRAGAILTDRAGAEIAAAELAGSTAALVVVEDPKAAFANACALWFGAQPETMVAVTGTNGKTSVASFTRQIWAALGHDAANIGTTGVEGAFSAPGIHTTPDPLTLHRLLADMAAAGISHCSMEASSHGLDQRRMEAVHLAAAAFTNFTQDHLDYHGTMEAYFDAKARLFTELLPEESTAVINLDDSKGALLADICERREIEVITVGQYAEDARLKITGRRMDETGQDVLFRWQGSSYQVRLDLIGAFQAMNVLTAAGLVIGAGEEPAEVFAALQQVQGVRGRMQLAATRENGAPVYVDYSHTPDSIETALKALRPHVMGRLVIVFGAGGDRDRGKRPLMGKAAAEHADVLIVTDDNPRSEDPAAIRAEVMAGCPEATNVGDRAEAILRAVDALGPGDALLIAGKGHETGQQVGDVVYPFDDVEQASVAVAALEGRI
ncbi:UDP-N-acetylmuramoyl-L-alanyl-D-glutamate--2,6-diaminopimelate ligase [Nioella sediminis]|jgi:UDP-N-acetylmuramoyl-L-alanyl-D-glutamate--2,6-diaminopimelate ligase|uniref:UDP-N-acetylmuramoyl-L-alanyl-D-glutamate--2, 6-diaminopimelate ligase n=1 Tax=Nioella sediminis TaxID=1912092 RepID=UPI0008FD67A5|nr:UDP-N-acetylmuramoyl-L-alanyl-D-glutamate--2,6-diaminopimelate ligase [Nioella sediminis]TBX27632.1 UDP-N-acetylmuramoylalanyl-D-glutamate--2,6-diaminopimelate ligase [Roseovarius sp. JS7-11]